MAAATYVLPIRLDQPPGSELDELSSYLKGLTGLAEVLVVDGSPAEIYRLIGDRLPPVVRHLPVDPRWACANGKVAGVMTGVSAARSESVVIADEDVRYRPAELVRICELLAMADLVRPQNYFRPLTWHARWDTARSLLNRCTGGDWPGTLALRRSILLKAGGYDGKALFENLELVRTVRAAGGTELVALDLYISRRPPNWAHFASQRLRQAYDELARPVRLLLFLSILPTVLLALLVGAWPVVALAAAGSMALAEAGRRRAGGTEYFPFSASLCAPAWLLERGLFSWLAILAWALLGGVPYRGRILQLAANSPARLRERLG